MVFDLYMIGILKKVVMLEDVFLYFFDYHKSLV